MWDVCMCLDMILDLLIHMLLCTRCLVTFPSFKKLGKYSERVRFVHIVAMTDKFLLPFSNPVYIPRARPTKPNSTFQFTH